MRHFPYFYDSFSPNKGSFQIHLLVEFLIFSQVWEKVPLFEPRAVFWQFLKFVFSCKTISDPETVEKHVHIHEDVYAACDQAHAVVVCTEWDEFKVKFFTKLHRF